MTDWPVGWAWPVSFTHHLLRRMLDRGFNETDLRLMMEDATGYHVDVEPGRWVIESRHDGREWELIVEPLMADKELLVVTAYPVY